MLLSAKDEQISSLSRQIEQLSLSLSESHKETQGIVSELSATIKKLSKQLYGSRSEKLSKLSTKAKEDIVQAPVPEHEVNQQDSAIEQQPVVEKVKQTKPQRRVYEGLEERVIVLEPLEDTTGARLLREEEIIRYSYIPPKIIRTIYKRLIYGNGDKVFTAPFPSHLIERCLADNSLLAAITVNKFGYHIPIQRQLEIFKNIGIDWSKSTVNSWVVRIIQILVIGNLESPNFGN
jgi:hypothetical protein